MNEKLEDKKPATSAGGTRSSRRGSRLWMRLFFLPLIAIAGLFMISMSATRPDTLSHSNGRLAECPTTPNCVATQSGDEQQRMSPVKYSTDADQAVGNIKSIVSKKFSRAKLVSDEGNYLHYEFTSLIFRFVDDVEFLVDDKAKEIHFRSASRVGHSDLGANRKRMQTIVDELNQ